jgi:monoamine oxidase
MLAAVDVHLGSVVTEVLLTDTGVEVRLDSGAVETADAIVVTVPLGVLQAETIRFDPPLPAAHLAARNGLTMGLLDKVLLLESDTVWGDDVIVRRLPGSGPPPYREWYNLEPATGAPITMALLGGREAAAWSGTDDAAVTAAARAALDEIRASI